jgi:predicted dehydrogenase
LLNAAILGLGWRGRTVVAMLRGSGALRITAGFDPDATAAAPVAAHYRLRLVDGFDDILRDPAIDAVILCTPHTLHAGQIRAAARAGKHVFCEKPLGLTRDDAAAAIAVCRDAGVVLGVGHERRFEPPILALRALAGSGVLGTLLQIEANFSHDRFLFLPPDDWRFSDREAPAGPMTATGIDMLDLAVSLLGPAEQAHAQLRKLGGRPRNGETLGVMLGFRSGANALISAILATPFDGRFAIYGSKGWAEMRDKGHPENPEGWTLTEAIRGRERKVTDYAPVAAVRANLEAFATAAQGGAPYPVPQEEMLNTIAALEAVFRSAASGAIEMVAG